MLDSRQAFSYLGEMLFQMFWKLLRVKTRKILTVFIKTIDVKQRCLVIWSFGYMQFFQQIWELRWLLIVQFETVIKFGCCWFRYNTVCMFKDTKLQFNDTEVMTKRHILCLMHMLFWTLRHRKKMLLVHPYLASSFMCMEVRFTRNPQCKPILPLENNSITVTLCKLLS